MMPSTGVRRAISSAASLSLRRRRGRSDAVDSPLQNFRARGIPGSEGGTGGGKIPRNADYLDVISLVAWIEAPVEGMEALLPVLKAGGLELLTDALPDGAHVLVCDPEKVRTRATDLVRTGKEFLEASWTAASIGAAAPLDTAARRCDHRR